MRATRSENGLNDIDWDITPDEGNKDREKECLKVRGVCAVIQAMGYPSIKHLNEQLNLIGYKVVPNKKKTNIVKFPTPSKDCEKW